AERSCRLAASSTHGVSILAIGRRGRYPSLPPMNDASTGAMQQFRAAGPPGNDRRGQAGLVLLYAEPFALLPPVLLLEGKKVMVGRDEAADIRLEVSAVSRRHAELRLERGRWVVTDQGSRNGTLVDGHLIDEAELEHCSEIRIGDSIFK